LKLRSDVVAFKGLSGEHSGGNLGRYFVGLCERVGIITQSRSKVCRHLPLSNLCSLSVYCYLLLFFLIFVCYQSIVIFYCFFLSSVLMAILTDNFSSSIPLLSITLQTIGLPARQSRIYMTIEASQNGAVRRINYRESQYNLALVPNVPM